MADRVSLQEVLRVLSDVPAPGGGNIVSREIVKDLELGEQRASFTLQLAGPSREQIAERARRAVVALGIPDVRVSLAAGPSADPASGAKLIPGVKSTIAVASGKGGVGKSTVAVNLAIALHRAGARVGLMDTDVYGPSVPHLMGSRTAPVVLEGKIAPPVEHGLKIMSMAYFLPTDEAVIWRGPMLHKAIRQFLGDVSWGELDYLVIDLPPGTGDIQLSLSQTIPLTGAVIVSTPQDVAMSVASKAIAMFQKLSVPILGVVENMSYYACPHCGHREDIFGHGGARAAAKKMGFAFLGEVPLDLSIRVSGDRGLPAAMEEATVGGKAFRELANAVMEQVQLASEAGAQDIRLE